MPSHRPVRGRTFHRVIDTIVRDGVPEGDAGLEDGNWGKPEQEQTGAIFGTLWKASPASMVRLPGMGLKCHLHSTRTATTYATL
jgi:hypothetical protein